MARRSWAKPKGRGRVDSARFGMARERESEKAPAGGNGGAQRPGREDAYRPPAAAEGNENKKPRRRRVVPTITFVLGLLLGAGAVIGLVAAGLVGGRVEAVPAPAPTPTGLTLTVPESCDEAGALSARVIDITEEIVVETRDFNPARLQVLVDQLQQLDPQLRAATERCNADSGTPTVS